MVKVLFGVPEIYYRCRFPVVRGPVIQKKDWMMKKLWMFGLSLALGVGMSQAARQMEWLNRGLVAVKKKHLAD